jgi:hypothetical protein
MRTRYPAVSMALLPLALVAACTSDSKAPRSVPSTATASAQPTVTKATEAPEFGPRSVRVLSAKTASQNTAHYEVIGPVGATYQFRTKSGKVVSCGQANQTVDASAPPGMPSNSVQHAALTCQDVDGAAGTLLAKVNFDAFDYEFEIPVSSAT